MDIEQALKHSISFKLSPSSSQKLIKHCISSSFKIAVIITTKTGYLKIGYLNKTADRECPLSQTGNIVLDTERKFREDPLKVINKTKKKKKKKKKKSKLQTALKGYFKKRK